jgi:hypothetical protein
MAGGCSGEVPGISLSLIGSTLEPPLPCSGTLMLAMKWPMDNQWVGTRRLHGTVFSAWDTGLLGEAVMSFLGGRAHGTLCHTFSGLKGRFSKAQAEGLGNHPKTISAP